MDTDKSLQDIVRCHICEDHVPSLHCAICDTHLCNDCEWEHISDESEKHKIVSFRMRRSYRKCPNHFAEVCERYCEQCDKPVCVKCLFSKKHKRHDIIDIATRLENKKEALQRDLQELEQSLYPSYGEIANSIPVQKTQLQENIDESLKAIDTHEEYLHREIHSHHMKMKSDLNEIKSKQTAILIKHEDEIRHMMSEITKSIADLKKMMGSNDIFLISDYISRNEEFRKLPSKVAVSLPSFIPPVVNRELYQQFGSLSLASFKTEQHGYAADSPGAECSSPDRPLIGVPRVITELSTEYEQLRGVCCQRDNKIWTCGYDNTLKLYNLHGELKETLTIRLQTRPWDIAVTNSGDLVFTSDLDRTVNIVNNTQIKVIIRLREWRPNGVCSTYIGDLLVVMVNDNKETKVVRYSDSSEKQSIQYDDKGRQLYSTEGTKYICENRNLDICVSDYRAFAVVVVNRAGKLRFKYAGLISKSRKSFKPFGITTDSQSQILIADFDSNRIHILSKDGQFIRYIDNCDLYGPWGLCIDTKDNLFVAENSIGRVKKIQYLI